MTLDRRIFIRMCSALAVVLSREYVEMCLSNLSATGETLREVFARCAA